MRNLILTVIVLAAPSAFAVPIVHTSDFIDDTDRTNFVDFEHMPAGFDLDEETSFDGVDVEQGGGGGPNIWTTCGLACWYTEISQSWYPGGGDDGFTEIRKSDGSAFDDMGFDYGGVKFGIDVLTFELLFGGTSVLSGWVEAPFMNDGYLGFSGGGFDTVRVRGNFNIFDPGVIGDGDYQALPIDNIELRSPAQARAVPEPGTIALLGFGLALIGFASRQRTAGLHNRKG